MHPLQHRFGQLALLGLFALLTSWSHLCSAQDNSVGLETVVLDDAPLYATGNRAKPTLTLALSIEEPTVGANISRV